MNNLLTIFTPTYNRGHLLETLYNSLINQTNLNFEWVIVDDGSSDNTHEIVNSFVNSSKIDITYFFQKNSGKHIAINKGLDLAKGIWFFIVDSDDYLLPYSIETIYNAIHENDTSFLSGFAYRRGNKELNSIGGSFPGDQKQFISTMVDRTVKYKISGDMAEIFKTDLLRRCKFDEGINERFCAEGLMWNRTSRMGAKLLFIDKIIYICEYLPGGLTANSIANRRKSPKYASLVYKELSQLSGLPLKYKFKALINYWRFAYFDDIGFGKKMHNLNYNFLGFIALPFGLVYKFLDDIKMEKNA